MADPFTRDPCDGACSRTLKDRMAAIEVEITVSRRPPIVAGPYTADAFVCPHSVEYWIEPTGEQIARWVEDGVQ
jgi:hypothetical protein